MKFTAEFTTNHLGNYNLLISMLHKAKETGATFVKMAKKDVESFYSKEKLNSPYKSPYGNSYRDYRKIFEFDKKYNKTYLIIYSVSDHCSFGKSRYG